MWYCVNIILVQGFCPLKIEITQFPDGFHLNSLNTYLPFGDHIINSRIFDSIRRKSMPVPMVSI